MEYLLESGADIDIKNFVKQTPLFSAIEGMHRRVTRVSPHLLNICHVNPYAAGG